MLGFNGFELRERSRGIGEFSVYVHKEFRQQNVGQTLLVEAKLEDQWLDWVIVEKIIPKNLK